MKFAAEYQKPEMDLRVIYSKATWGVAKLGVWTLHSRSVELSDDVY